MHSNWFCVNCHAIGTYETHYPTCTTHESYAIPASAEVPRKNASKRIWNIFKEQFVFAKPVGCWIYKDKSWWHIGKDKKQQPEQLKNLRLTKKDL